MRLLAALFGADRPELSVVALARHCDVAATTASRELRRLEDYGVVTGRSVGRTRLVRAAWEQPWAQDLAALLGKTVGVPAQLAAALGGVVGVNEAFVFGSWAARFEGSPGSAPQDIDVLVVGDADPYEVRRACRRVEDAVGLEVNPIVVARARWDDCADSFVQTVRSEPLVPIAAGRAA